MVEKSGEGIFGGYRMLETKNNQPTSGVFSKPSTQERLIVGPRLMLI